MNLCVEWNVKFLAIIFYNWVLRHAAFCFRDFGSPHVVAVRKDRRKKPKIPSPHGAAGARYRTDGYALIRLEPLQERVTGIGG
jgi:hypothetical protein